MQFTTGCLVVGPLKLKECDSMVQYTDISHNTLLSRRFMSVDAKLGRALAEAAHVLIDARLAYWGDPSLKDLTRTLVTELQTIALWHPEYSVRANAVIVLLAQMGMPGNEKLDPPLAD